MFSELPDLVDRNFVLAFFLPMILFLLATYQMIQAYGLLPNFVTALHTQEILVNVTLLGLASWLGGIFLLTSNYELIRLIEGYGKFNPIKLVGRLEKRAYSTLSHQIASLDSEIELHKKYIDELGKDINSAKQQEIDRLQAIRQTKRIERARLMRDFVQRFPDSENWLLPTAIGNIIRAFEIYPRVMYGLEGIEGWSRLLTIIPKDYRDLIDNNKASMDFWLNIWLLSLIFFSGSLSFVITTGHLEALWWVVGAALVSVIAPWRAESAALRWGEMVKAAFDFFLPVFCKKLGFDVTNKKLLTEYSRAIIYRMSDKIPPIHVSSDEINTPKSD